MDDYSSLAAWNVLEDRLDRSFIEKKKDTNMGNFTSEEIEEALRPIASLISKSEKAQQKLAPGTWQHTMLQNNLKALHIAFTLMNDTKNSAENFIREDLQEGLRAIASMISRSEKAQAKFSPGTSQYSLQRNRIKALHIAEELIGTALEMQG